MLLSFFVLLCFARCQKENNSGSDTPNAKTETVEKPRKIVLSFFRQNTLLKKWIYEIDSLDLASPQGVVYWTDSSYNSFPGQSTFYKARQTYVYDPSAGMFSALVSRNYRSGSINHWVNNQVTLQESPVNNFALSNTITGTSPSGINAHNFLLKLYSDSMQQRSQQTFQNSVGWHWLNAKRYVEVVYGPVGAWNFFEFNHDSTYLKEALTTHAVNYPAESRYFNYYANELPWYSRKKEDRSVFYTRSPYTCDSFVLRNGDYVFASSTSAGIFTSSLERKVTYQYTADTTDIKTFIDVINPIARSRFGFT